MLEITTATDSQCVHCFSEAVVATMRDLTKRGPLEEAAGDSLNKTLEIKELDACCEASIRECVNSLPDRRVDVLGLSLLSHIHRHPFRELKMSPHTCNDINSAVIVNNAGVGMIGPLECQSIAAMKELFDTNFFGLARLVKELLPDMKRRQSGHIVVMSSVMGIQGAFHMCRWKKRLEESKEVANRFPYVSTQGFSSMTSILPPNLQWKDFVKVWQCKPWSLTSSDYMSWKKH